MDEAMPLRALARDGAPAADGSFDALFLAEYPRVVRVAYRVLGDAAAADDVAQEVFIAFLRRQPDPAAASSWLHAAAVHTALNAIRGERRRDRREATSTEAAARGGADPVEAAEQAERRREVRETLAKLPERTAAVLALRYSGCSYAEIGSAIGVRTDQVGTLLRRAEAAFRKEVTRGTSR